MANWIPVNEITKQHIGKSAHIAVGEGSYLIMNVIVTKDELMQDETKVVVSNGTKTLILKTGYIGLNGSQRVKMIRNCESGIIHATINGRCLCGVRHSRDSEHLVNTFATCEKCIELINK